MQLYKLYIVYYAKNDVMDIIFNQTVNIN